jgi:hypothetical protein
MAASPKDTPKVRWEVTKATNEMNGDMPMITKQLAGHVNSSYPQITVDVQVTLTTPASAKGPVPVIMEFGFTGMRGPVRPAAPGPTWQQQVLARGWMVGNFIKFAGSFNWNDLPVDSHELVALCAPRPVLISAGATSGDGWMDAKGMFLVAAGAGPVYRLLGKKDLGTTEFPPIGTTLIKHGLTAETIVLTWRLRRLYHAEAGFWAFKTKAWSALSSVPLHELQRLRNEQGSNLALVSQETPVGQVPDLPTTETNNIQPTPPAAAPAGPAPNSADVPETAAHTVPEAADMQ